MLYFYEFILLFEHVHQTMQNRQNYTGMSQYVLATLIMHMIAYSHCTHRPLLAVTPRVCVCM